LEVDNAPPDANVEVDFKRERDANFVTQASLPAPRRQRVGFSPQGEQGALLFETLVEDWPIELDTRGIKGQRELRARMQMNKRDIMPPVVKTVTLDNTPPVNVRFLTVSGVGVPSKGEVKLPPNATSPLTVLARGEDGESGIKEVFFFLGKPEDKKVPPTAKPLRATPGESPAEW